LIKWILIMSFLFGQPAIETKPKPKPPPITSNQKWMALAPHVKRHFKTDMDIKEIAAELSYAEYKMNKDKK